MPHVSFESGPMGQIQLVLLILTVYLEGHSTGSIPTSASLLGPMGGRYQFDGARASLNPKKGKDELVLGSPNSLLRLMPCVEEVFIEMESLYH